MACGIFGETMNKYFYILSRRDDGRYSHIDINIFRQSDTEESFPSPLLALTWQGDIETCYWYAFKASSHVESPQSAQRLIDAGKLLAKLIEDSPEKVLEALAALGLERMVRDDRDDHNRWIKVTDAKPADWKRYMSRGSDGNCVCSCIADNESTAQSLIERQYGKMIAEGPHWGYAQKLADWITSGRRVEIDYHRQAPDVRDVADILKPRKESIVESEAA